MKAETVVYIIFTVYIVIALWQGVYKFKNNYCLVLSSCRDDYNNFTNCIRDDNKDFHGFIKVGALFIGGFISFTFGLMWPLSLVGNMTYNYINCHA